MKAALNILLGIALLTIALSFLLVFANTHPPRYPLHIPPSHYQARYEEVSFVTEDGITLKGWVIPTEPVGAKAPGIILCHGLGANRSDFTDLAVSLARRGYVVLTFDFRAHGESGGWSSSLGLREQKDVAAALACLRSRADVDAQRIGIYGFSLGGATAVLAADRNGGFRAVVADSAFTSLKDQARTALTGFYHLPAFPFLPLTTLGYRLFFFASVDEVDPERAIANLSPVPVLVIAGEGDDLIPVENGTRLHAAAREPKELWIVPNAAHGGTLAAAGAEYDRRVGAFFDRHLKR